MVRCVFFAYLKFFQWQCSHMCELYLGSVWDGGTYDQNFRLLFLHGFKTCTGRIFTPDSEMDTACLDLVVFLFVNFVGM